MTEMTAWTRDIFSLHNFRGTAVTISVIPDRIYRFPGFNCAAALRRKVSVGAFFDNSLSMFLLSKFTSPFHFVHAVTQMV